MRSVGYSPMLTFDSGAQQELKASGGCEPDAVRTEVGLSAFHEKAGMSQACFSVFLFILPVDSFRSSRAASVAILPSALLVERFSLGAWWVFPIQ